MQDIFILFVIGFIVLILQGKKYEKLRWVAALIGIVWGLKIFGII